MRFVTANKPVTTTHKDLGELSTAVEVPQLDSMEEFVTFCGGNDGALEFINNAVETAAKNGGRATLRNAAKDADVAKVYEDTRRVVKEYTPRTGGDKAPSKAKKIAVLDSVTALVESGQEFTRDQLLELLAKAK